MALFLPQRWRRQPPGPTAIDWSSPIARGLVSSVTPSGGFVDAVSGLAGAALGSGVSESIVKGSRALTFSGSQANAAATFGQTYNVLAGATRATFEAIVNTTSAQSTEGAVISKWDDGTGSAGCWGLWIEQDGDLQLVVTDGTLIGTNHGTIEQTTATPCAGLGYFHLFVTWNGGNSATATVNGVDYAFDSHIAWGWSDGSSIGSANNVHHELGRTSYSPSAFAGSIVLARLYNRALLYAERQELTRNPWQLYAPQHRILYWTDAVAGGTTHEVSAAEGSASATDANSATAIFAETSVEGTASATDAPESTYQTAAAAAEGSASASDAPSNVYVTADEVAEGSATASDAPSNVYATAAATAEGTASATDAPSADLLGQQSGTVAEGSATAADTSSTIATLVATGAEGSATATDAPTGANTTAAAVTEGSATATDACDWGVAVYSDGCAEGSATAADTVSCVIVAAGSIAEGTASAADVAAAIALFQATGAEGSATAADYVSFSGLASTAEIAEGSSTAADIVWDANPGTAPDSTKSLHTAGERIGLATVDTRAPRLG